MTKTRTQEEFELLEALVAERQLIVFNDDVNTFDFVIEAFIKVCKHDPIQAEQCAHLVHFTGKCAVKHGDWDTLEPMCTALLDRGISAEIH